MLRKILSAALAVSLLGLSGNAYAAPWWDRGAAEHRDGGRDRDDRRVEHRDFDRDHDRGRHAWVRGERFVPRGEYVVVRDWRFMHLAPPRVGFHWVREGDFFLLINDWNGMVGEVVAAPY